MEAVYLLYLIDSQYLHNITIGNKAHLRAFVHPIVIVFHGHQIISCRNLVFPEQDPVSNLTVEHESPLIGTGNGHNLVMIIVIVQCIQLIFQGHSRNTLKIWKLFLAEKRKVIILIFQLMAKLVRIEQNTGIQSLSHHICQLAGHHIQIERMAKIIYLQSRTFVRMHWRQLCIITDKEQFILVSLENKINEILQHAPRRKQVRTLLRIGNHRHLVHNEQSIIQFVLLPAEMQHTFLHLHSVNMLVDSKSLVTGIHRKNLCRATCRRQQHHTLPQLVQCLHQRTHQSSLTRAGIAFQHKQTMGLGSGHKLRQHADCRFLPLCGLKRNLLTKTSLKILFRKHVQ